MYGKLLTFILVLVFLASITNAEQVEPTVSDPIHWWRFDEGAGLTAADSGTIGTLNGVLQEVPDEPNWISGMLDFALDFGFDAPTWNHVEFAAQPNLGTNRLTLAAWIKPRTWDGPIAHQALIGTRNIQSGPNNGWDMVVDESLTDPNMGALLFLVSGGQAVWHTVQTDPVMTLGNWYHVAVTYDGTWVTLYIDGNYEHSVALTLNVEPTGSQMRIGRSHWPPDAPFNGKIDDFRLFNRALSADAIRGLFLNTRPDVEQAWEPNPYSENGAAALGTNLEWLPGNNATSHDVYFGTTSPGTFQVNLPVATTTFDPGTLDIDTTYFWRIDSYEPNSPGPDILHPGVVWSFTTEDGAAFNPTPANGTTVADLKNVVLRWVEGGFQAESGGNEVYFGTDPNEVADATRTVHPNVTYVVRDPNYYGPLAGLEMSTTYYWRVDQYNNPDTWPGPVWNFTTPDYVAVDDFESYGDISSNWTANFGGGDLMIEDSVVNNGDQSMSFSYSNYSEAERSTSFTNWTSEGVNALAVSLQSDNYNPAEQVFVALTDSDSGAAVYVGYPDPNAPWLDCNIDLQDFSDAGIDLADVQSVTIGVGNYSSKSGSGSGVIYVDDIRLYPTRCVPELGPAGDVNGDCVVNSEDIKMMAGVWLESEELAPIEAPPVAPIHHWEFEEGTGGSMSQTADSGTPGGKPGTLKGLAFGGDSPDWVPGKIGTWALDFEQDTTTDGDYVDCGPDPIVLDPNTQVMTVMAWIKAESWANSNWMDVIASTHTWAGGGAGFELRGGQFTPGDPRGVLNFTVRGIGGWVTTESEPFMSTGTWYHVTGLYDGAQLRVYIDGDFKNALTTPVNLVSSNELWIGQSPLSGHLFDGLIDDVRVYNYDLTQAQILGAMGAPPQVIPLSDTAAAANVSEDPVLQVINLKDFAVMAYDWLVEDLFP